MNPTSVAILARLERAADPLNPDAAEATRALGGELDLIEQCTRALVTEDPELALRLIAAIEGPFGRSDETARGIDLTEFVLGSVGDAFPSGRARALASLASQRNLAGDLSGAQDAAEAAKDLGTRADDPRAVVRAWTALAGVAYQRGELDQMEAAAAEAVTWGAHDEAYLGHAIHLWTLAAKARGDAAEMRRRAGLSIAWGERHGDRRLVATEHANLGDFAFEFGTDEAAARHYGEAIDRFVAMGRVEELPGLLPGLAAIAARRGNLRVAGLLEGAVEQMAPAIDSGAAGDPASLWAGPLASGRERGGAAYQQWHDEGRGLSMAEMIDLARAVVADDRT